MSKIVGIIGGMGPLSTIKLLEKIFESTSVKREQDHLRILVDNRPQIPDRTDFILGEGVSPLPMLEESAKLLQAWGADFLAIACNTAHYFYSDLIKSISIPLLNMLKIVAAEVHRQISAGEKVAILTTSGARRAKLFEPYLRDYKLVYPDDRTHQSNLMEAVYGCSGIKSESLNEENVGRIKQTMEEMIQFQPALIIAGCTEIELALKRVPSFCQVIFPMDLLAKEIVRTAKQ
jgi:aspartate racemase